MVLSFFSAALLAVSSSRFGAENTGKRLGYDLPVDALVPEFLFDPAPAEPTEPDPARGPLLRELPVIHIPEPHEVGDNRLDDSLIKFLVAELLDQLRPAPRPVGKKTVSGILRPRQFFFF